MKGPSGPLKRITYDVVQSAIRPFAASFLQSMVNSVVICLVVLSPFLARATFFVGRNTAISHMSSCMIHTSRERHCLDGWKATWPHGVR